MENIGKRSNWQKSQEVKDKQWYKIFNQLCKAEGIAKHRTIIKTPQQNGLAKRMNITILERVTCMLFSSGLSKSFWVEATVTTMYHINISSSSTINFKTPQKMWSRKPSRYDHLRIFGCTANAHVSDGKLDLRTIKCIFLGYYESIKGYKL